MNNGLNILIVDDMKMNNAILSMYLKQISGNIITVFEATSAEQALKIIDTNIINYIFTDIKMPGMSGIEMGRELKKRNINVPLIFISTEENSQYLNDTEFNTHPYIHKPYTIEELNSVWLKVADN